MNFSIRIILSCISIITSISLSAQSITCDSLSIQGIEADTTNSNNSIVQIEMAGTASDFINYPYIAAIWDCNGDTVATGGLFYFGQLGQTVQGYPVTSLPSDVCYPLSIQFVYGYGEIFPSNDTCLFSYGDETLDASEQTLFDWTLFPNPADNEIRFSSNQTLVGEAYSIYDITGNSVQSGLIQSIHPTIRVDELAVGMYFLRIKGRSLPFIKE